MSAARVLIADDHPVYGHGLSRLLESYESIEVVAVCGDGRAALDKIRELRPDVAVLDYRMPALDGMTLLGTLRAEGSETRVAILSGQCDAEDVAHVLNAGAAYLVKTAAPEEIAAMIARVAASNVSVSSPTVVFTKREREILELAMERLSRAEIAERLNVTDNTVKSHLTNVYHKLGVKSRAAAVQEATRRGML